MTEKLLSEVHAIKFDQGNPNWIPEAELNRIFIKHTMSYLQNVLSTMGHLFLNDVFVAFRAPRTRDGALAGWLSSEGYLRYEVDQRENDFYIVLYTQGPIYDKI